MLNIILRWVGLFLWFGFMLAATPLQAAMVDYSFTNGIGDSIGSVAIGQYGTITARGADRYDLPVGFYGAFGTLPAMSQITFSYSITGCGAMSGPGYSNYGEAGLYAFNDPLQWVSVQGYGGHTSSVLGSDNQLPQLLLANMNVPGTKDIKFLTSTLTNLTNQAVFFRDDVVGNIDGGKVTIHYEVSAVPLPASAVCFFLALLFLGCIKRSRARPAKV